MKGGGGAESSQLASLKSLPRGNQKLFLYLIFIKTEYRVSPRLTRLCVSETGVVHFPNPKLLKGFYGFSVQLLKFTREKKKKWNRHVSDPIHPCFSDDVGKTHLREMFTTQPQS